MRSVAPSMLAPPALPRDFVTRPALRATLDSGADRTLTLVCAPPGFGKSLLLADWVRRAPDIPAVWVTLEEDHDDPRLFWTAVLAGLRACPAVPASSGLHRLVVSRTGVEPGFVDDVLRALVALPRPLRLILDDAQHLCGGPVVRHLHLLARDSGPHVHPVLASRLDPPLPLARLRLDDDLRELRAEQLRFTRSETTTLLERTGLHLDPGQADLLHERTDGWVAGLRLAARSLRDGPDPDAFLADFSGDERTVADFLVGDVLAGIPEAQLDVLRCTSVADPIPSALAVELCGREDAADLLDALARDLGLVTRWGPDRAEFRVQTMLRSYLAADLQRQGPDRVAALHRRAARWWDRRSRPAEALRHASRTADPVVVLDLVRRRAGTLVASGEHGVLAAALEAVDEAPTADAWRAALSAHLLLHRGDVAGAATAVRRGRRASRAPGAELRALLTAAEGLAGMEPTPSDDVPPEDPALALLARAGRGAAEIGAGSPARARSDLLAALDGARRLGLPLLEVQCLSLLGMAAWTAGDLTEAARTTAEATAAVRDGGWDRTGPAACVHAVAALTALGRARPGSAAEAAESGLRADAAALEPQVRFALRVARGGALFDSGEKAAGLLELQQARAELGEASVHGGLVAVSALVEHRIALRLGYGNAAAAVGVWLAARSGTTQEQLLLRAWTEAAAGAHRAARSTVDPLLGRAARPAWSGTVVEAWLVAAHVALQEGDRPAARQALRTALDRARALDLVRPFTLSPTAVRALLVDELVGGHDRGRFAGRILAVPPPGAWPAGVVLTGRERDVLSRLPSLLNLDEIAGDLSVSVNTVKSHVQSIYDKLGAGSRRRAVLAAHEQGLLR